MLSLLAFATSVSPCHSVLKSLTMLYANIATIANTNSITTTRMMSRPVCPRLPDATITASGISTQSTTQVLRHRDTLLSRLNLQESHVVSEHMREAVLPRSHRERPP